MKILAITFGTEGDTRPLASLGHALLEAHHEVMLLAAGGTLDSARDLKVPHAALKGDVRQAFQSGGELGSLVSDGTSVSALARGLARMANDHVTDWMRQTLKIAADYDALLCAGLAAFVGFSVAERVGIPAVGAGMIPLTPTASFPSAFLSQGPVPKLLNRFSHQLVNTLIWNSFRKSTNAARTSVCGLAPRRRNWTEVPMVYGISPTLLPRPPDWPSDVYLCGQWQAPPRHWTAPPALLEFLSQGEAPLYIGFGSMAGFRRKDLLTSVVEAVAGRRALFYPGWGQGEELTLPKNFLVIGDTPHDWLFPQTSLVMHHGGSGTSHSAARAGVPSVVLPFGADQFFWAERLRALRVAPKNPGAQKISADALTRAVGEASADEMRRRAAQVGEHMRCEDGLRSAVRAIESLVG